MNRAGESMPFADSQQYERRLAHDYFVRIHMSLILMAVTVSGVLTSKGLLELGVHSLRLRFPLAVLASYMVFLLLIRLWIWYVSIRQSMQAARTAQNGVDAAAGFALGAASSRTNRSRRSGDGSSLGIGDWSGSSSGGGGGSIGGGGGSGGFSGFGGGSSGGGGASSSWDSDLPVGAGSEPSFVAVPSGGPSTGASGGSWFPKLDFNLDFDGDGWLILVLLAALVLAILGAGGYLIYAAPHILPDAACQALLATTLTRVSKEEHHNWMAGVLRSTCIPFAIVLLFAGALGWEAHHYCPAAPRLVDVLLQCVLS